MTTTERASIGGADISTLKDTHDSHFLSLPPELRNRIYEGDEDPSPNEERSKVIRSGFNLNEDGDEQSAGGNSLPLLRTCTQIKKEAAQLFYVCNAFEIQGHLPESSLEDGLVHCGVFATHRQREIQLAISALQEFVDTIGMANARVLTDVVFTIGQVDAVDLDGDFKLDHAIAIIKMFRDLVQPFHAAQPSWRLRLRITLVVTGDEWKGDNEALEEVCLDMDDFRRGAVSATTALHDRAARDEDLSPDISNFYSFLGKLRMMA
ncbi:hypothetical protein LTR17_001124 [Elasticomyces elasticus]|nr:hypothetical protein LTR17_001124 [Elasticomyces elasticus]